MGDRDLAASFAAQAADPARPLSSKRSPLLPAGDPPPSAAAWRTALAAAGTHEQTRRALYQLAAAGQLAGVNIAAAEGRESASAEAIAVLTARNDAANGQADAAVTVLREHRDAYPPAAELLIEVLEIARRDKTRPRGVRPGHHKVR